MIRWISFIKLLDVLPAFDCTRAVVNLRTICLGLSLTLIF